MKKNLLYSVLTLILITSVSIAQTKVWDFGAEPLGSGFTNMITIANQTNCALFNPGSPTGGSTSVPTIAASANFGNLLINTAAGDRWRSDNTSLVLYDNQLNNNNVAPVFAGATNSGRLAFNGTGNATRRYYTITLAAGETVTFYYKSNVITAGNWTVTVPSGSSVPTTATVPAVTNSYDMRVLKLTADIAGNYTIGEYVNKPEMYRIYQADVDAGITLSSENFESSLSLDIFSIKNKVYFTNIKSDTNIEVYNISGVLVKSIRTSIDTSLELNTAGVYIINSKSDSRIKSVKVLIK